MSASITGIVYYASDEAVRNRYYKEGQRVTISDYKTITYRGGDFVEVNLNNSGTSYLHLSEAVVGADAVSR